MKTIDLYAFCLCKETTYEERKKELLKENEKYKDNPFKQNLIEENQKEINNIDFELKTITYLEDNLDELYQVLDYKELDFSPIEFMERVSQMYEEFKESGSGIYITTRRVVN